MSAVQILAAVQQILRDVNLNVKIQLEVTNVHVTKDFN